MTPTGRYDLISDPASGCTDSLCLDCGVVVTNRAQHAAAHEAGQRVDFRSPIPPTSYFPHDQAKKSE